MDRLCSRCARVQTVSAYSARATPARPSTRAFSTTQTRREDDGTAKPVSRPASIARSGVSVADAMRGPPTDRPAGVFLRRSAPATRSLDRSDSSGTPHGRPLIRRVTDSESGPILRRTADGRPQGQLLRRSETSPPRTFNVRRTPGGPAGAASQRQGRQPQQGPQKTRRKRVVRERAADNEDEEPSEAEVDEYVTKYIDRPVNPTEPITYNPEPQNVTELQKDWPNTPISSAGLTASLVQKIEWLARRLPHGYQTPEQIAEHYQKGYLTRFESEEEKEMVLKIAKELAQKKADSLMEGRGEQVAPSDMAISELTSNTGDKNILVDSIVKGNYPGLEKQRMPFLDNIVRTLRNNETYGSTETSKFMAKIQSMMPSQAQRRAPTPKSA